MEPVNFGEDLDDRDWAALPDDSRLLVGGRTVWTRPPASGVLVTQPNRWGLAEDRFPDVPCLVEIDPVVAGLLPRPATVQGWLDRRHRPIPPPQASSHARYLLELARRLGARLNQVKSVRILARPNARTVVFSTPAEPDDLIAAAHRAGIEGLRAITGMAGAVAAVMRPEQTDEHRDRLLGLVADVAARRVRP